MRDNLPFLNEKKEVNPQLMAFARLFRSEIGEFIHKYPSMHLQYLTSLNANEVNVEEFFDWFVLEILSNEETFRILHKEIQSKDPKLFMDIHMMRAQDEAVIDSYKKYFLSPSPFTLSSIDEDQDEEEDDGVTVVDRLSNCYHPDVTYLKTPYPPLGFISDPVSHGLHSTERNYRPYARAILRYLPNLIHDKEEEFKDYPSLVFRFAHSCRNNPMNMPALMYLLPDYSTLMAERDGLIQSRTKSDKKEEEKIEVITEFRDPEEFAEFRECEYKESAADFPLLREYQKELSKEAEDGENTVIVAPTGSGKTVVAAHIIRQHIETRRDMRKGARVVIVAPTVPLVEQHGKVLYGNLKDVAFVDYLHGQFTNDNRIDVLLSNNVIVCTPQLLINCLQSIRKEDRLFISDFSLMILDECHHTCEKHPYAQLMSLVRKARMEAIKEGKGDVPQVVGMTASLGIGKQGLKDVDSGVDHVKGLLARMGATCISRVVNNEDELNMHVHRPSDQMEEVSRTPDKDAPFTTKITLYMKSILETIIESLRPFTSSSSDFYIQKSVIRSLEEIKKYNKFRSNVRLTGIISGVKNDLSRMRNGQEKVDLVDAIDMILLYTKTLDMNDVLPASKALHHMCMEVEEKMKTRTTNQYLDIFKKKELGELRKLVDCEKDKKMLAKLKKEVMSMDSSSRCIIFVETREVCKHICDYIQDFLPKGRKCGFVMSARSNGSSLINQPPTDQKATIKDFRDGLISIMVATTVANEGIDIPQCNLIIKYNMTGNIISKVQQEGRARAKGSRSILIVLSESVKERERENLRAQVVMKKILHGMYSEGKDKLKMDIKERMEELEKESKREEKEAKELEDNLSMNRYDILCGKCLSVICPSSSIKVDPTTTFYSVDPSIWGKIHVRIPKKMKSQSYSSMNFTVADVFCKNCWVKGDEENDIGKLYRISHCYLPYLRVNAIKGRNSDTFVTEEEWKGGWEDVGKTKIYISKITEEQKRQCLNGLTQSDATLFQKLEVRSEQIERKPAKRKTEPLNFEGIAEWDD